MGEIFSLAFKCAAQRADSFTCLLILLCSRNDGEVQHRILTIGFVNSWQTGKNREFPANLFRSMAQAKLGEWLKNAAFNSKIWHLVFCFHFLLILCARIIDYVEVFLKKGTGAGGRKPPFLAATPVCHLFRVGACREAGPGLSVINKNPCTDKVLIFFKKLGRSASADEYPGPAKEFL